MEPGLGHGLTETDTESDRPEPNEEGRSVRARVVAWSATFVVAVLAIAVVLGLTRPDGSVGDASPAPNVVTTGTPGPTPSPADGLEQAGPTSALAPIEVEGTWPGRPDDVTVDGGDVDWCPAVQVEASAAAVSAFGDDDVAAAACAAVSFVFDQRYARRSLPSVSSASGDFDGAVDAIASGTRPAYRSRVSAYLDRPTDTNAERLGLVLLTGDPGGSYRYYGARGTAEGYEDRAVWINPSWSRVRVDLDSSRSTPRLTTRFSASADLPVFDVAEDADAMMTVPTDVSMTLRRESGAWLIGGFDIRTGRRTFEPLNVS